MTLTNKQVGKYMQPQGRAQMGHSALGTVALTVALTVARTVALTVARTVARTVALAARGHASATV